MMLFSEFLNAPAVVLFGVFFQHSCPDHTGRENEGCDLIAGARKVIKILSVAFFSVSVATAIASDRTCSGIGA